MTTYALGRTGNVTLWCTGSIDKNGELDFDVINGKWKGHLEVNGVLTVARTKEQFSDIRILWSGDVPHEHARNYNDAMAWIETQLP